MEEYVCRQCGKPFIPSNQSRLQFWCSKSCAATWRWGVRAGRDFDIEQEWHFDGDKWSCPYRENIACRARRCSKCGWNPAVEKMRNIKLGVNV